MRMNKVVFDVYIFGARRNGFRGEKRNGGLIVQKRVWEQASLKEKERNTSIYPPSMHVS